ncbi:MAG: hypothetical protein LBR43_01300 [Spiroplasmataceae bacterium]|nr:hypothetical protein [Spiroplasmataceae bacterium]
MNWTASLLRNQLNKEKLAYEKKINLLKSNWNQEKKLLLEEKEQENNFSRQLVQELTANCQQLTSEQANKEEIITNQQEKISRLEAALTKPKKNQGTQTIIDYEAIIENEKKKNQELTNKLATSNELLRKLAEREREQNQRTDSNSDYESAEE